MTDWRRVLDEEMEKAAEELAYQVYKPKAAIRKFETGATRNLDENKNDYEAFLSPLVIEAFGSYMHSHRKQADGTLRDGDNWQKGIPLDAYMKSAWRHFFDVWKHHRKLPVQETLEEALCALMFNVMGYLHEHLKNKNNKKEHNAEGTAISTQSRCT